MRECVGMYECLCLSGTKTADWDRNYAFGIEDCISKSVHRDKNI